MKLQKRYFVGKNKPGIWASVYAYKPSNDDIFEKRGEIFAAAFLEGPADFDASIAGNLILDIMHETYFENEKNSTLDALEDAVKAAQSRLMSLVENDETAAIKGINFDIVLLVVKGRYCFSVRVGDGVLKIFRNGNLQDLSAGYRDPTGEGRYEVLSSTIKQGDTFFLATPQTVESYSDDEILESVSDFSEISMKNKMLEDDSKLAFLFIGMDVKGAEKVDSGFEMPTEQGNITEEELNPDQSIGEETGEEAGKEAGIGAENEDLLDKEGEQPLDEEGFTDKRKNTVQKLKKGFKEKYTTYKTKLGSASSNVKNKVGSRITKMKRRKGAIVPVDAPGDTAVKSASTSIEPKASSSIAPTSSDKSTIQVYIQKVLHFIKKTFIKIFKFIKEDILAIGREGLYLKGKNKKVNYRVIAVLVIALFLIFFIGMRVRRTAVNNARIERENKELAEELSNEVDSISNSSVFTVSSPDNITERENVLAQINELDEKMKTTEISSDYKNELDGYSKELADLKTKLLRIIPVQEPELLSDLGATFEGANPTDIAITKGKIYIPDQARNVIYEVNPEGGTAGAGAQREVIKSDVTAPRLITTDPEGGLVLLDGSATALASVNVETGQVTRYVGMSNDKLSPATEMTAYKVADNDIRLYFTMSVDPQVQQINKRAGYYSDGPKSRWEGEEYNGLTDIDLLDGKFFVLKAQAGLMRLYVNAAVTTNISGLLAGDSLNTTTKLAVDAQYVYFADSTNKRILVFTKSRGDNVDYLDLIAQYKYTGSGDTFSNIKDIVVDGVNIYVLDGAKVYKLSKSDFDTYKF